MAKIILKHSDRSAYWSQSGWSQDVSRAVEFKTSMQALDFCFQKNIREAVIVIKFSDPRFDIVLHPFADTS